MAERLEFMVEDAQLLYRNFAGKENQMNREGSRNFCVVLTKEAADEMVRDDWNVKVREPREDGEEPLFYIAVEVSWRRIPPKIVMITDHNRVHLDESTVECLDYADIVKVDLIAQASHWEFAGKTGIKAYLKTMFVTIREDALEKKYAMTPDSKFGDDPVGDD